MFTGIIEKTANVKSAQPMRGNLRVKIETPRGWKLKEGQSVAIDGVCSTVVASAPEAFSVEYVPETLSKTTAGSLKRGSAVNLERSLALGSFVDGHLVAGHVDTRATVSKVARAKGAYLLSIEVPKNLRRFVAPKGSIAVNGVSLTVARMARGRATVALIPHTLAHTNLGALKKGDRVNVEVDLVARYILNR